MSFLFRVERATDSDENNRLLGYDWVEVLAIEPWALGKPGQDYGSWCNQTVNCQYICLTPDGLTRITADDFWAALEDYEEYDPNSPHSTNAGIIITTGGSSVVQVGSGNSGGIHLTRDSYSAENVGAQGPKSKGKVYAAHVKRASDESREQLARELGELRPRLRQQARDVEHDVALGAIGEAEKAASQGDEDALVLALRRAGTWAAEIANQSRLTVAGSAISAAVGYVDTGLLAELEQKRSQTSWSLDKLTQLLYELNANFAEKRPYACHALIRAILDHVPPILVERPESGKAPGFDQVVSNRKWPRTDQAYVIKLKEFRAQGDDVLHRQIRASADLIDMSDLPPRAWMNALLRACLDDLHQFEPGNATHS